MIDRTQPEYRAIERLLSPRLQEILDKAFAYYREEALARGSGDFDQEALWDKVLDSYGLSTYERILLKMANSLWSGVKITTPLLELHGLDEDNKIRFITAMATYIGVDYIINVPEIKCCKCGRTEDQVPFLSKGCKLVDGKYEYTWKCPECQGYKILKTIKSEPDSNIIKAVWYCELCDKYSIITEDGQMNYCGYCDAHLDKVVCAICGENITEKEWLNKKYSKVPAGIVHIYCQ